MKCEIGQSPERPFEEKTVYFSGSIGGFGEVTSEFPEQLTAYMLGLGADILDPHVAISAKRKPDEFMASMLRSHGLSQEEWHRLSQQEKDLKIYEGDIAMVDRASHVVALVNGASFGVGMELQRALNKPALGQPLTPILGLVQKDQYDHLSLMVRGAAQKYPNFHLKTYASLTEAKQAIHEFLIKQPSRP